VWLATPAVARMARLTGLRAALGPPPRGQLRLNASIPWHVRVHGGTAHTSFDLSGLTLYALELGGVSDVAIGGRTRWHSPDYPGPATATTSPSAAAPTP
jgi:hypothetical protein